GLRLFPAIEDGHVRGRAARPRRRRAHPGGGPRAGRSLLCGAGDEGAWVSKKEKLRLGGMALRNGLLVHGPTHWAAAIRRRDGRIEVASGRKPALGANATRFLPGLRGVTRLAEALAVVPTAKRALPEAHLPIQDT